MFSLFIVESVYIQAVRRGEAPTSLSHTMLLWCISAYSLNVNQSVCLEQDEQVWYINILSSCFTRAHAFLWISMLTAFLKLRNKKAPAWNKTRITLRNCDLARLILLIYCYIWDLGKVVIYDYRFVSGGSPLVRELALCSQQFCAVVSSAKLAKLPASVQRMFNHPVTGQQQLISVSAG